MTFFTVADCGRGHFLNDSNECQACAIGFYLDETWRDRLDREMPFVMGCKMCSSGTSTAGEGSVSVDNCSSMFPFILYVIFNIWHICLSNRKFERLGGPLDEIVTVSVQKYSVIMPRRRMAS